MMVEKIITPEKFDCPDCKEPFGEDNLMELCGEPFNGVILECPSCKKEYKADLLIKVKSLIV